MNKKPMIRHEIYVGLTDQYTNGEEFTVEDFASLLVSLFSKKEIGFSMIKQLGGYSHNQGYVTETSLRITLFGLSDEDVKEIAERLKIEVNTDTVMITKEECDYYYR